MKIGKAVFSALVFGISALLGSYAIATIMPELTVTEMTNKSALVLIGKVESVMSKWNDDRTAIFTYVKIIPTSFLLGKTEQGFVVVELLGGTVGSITTTALGEATFSPDENVVVFLAKHPKQSDFYRVVGLAQGKFHIARSSNPKRMAVERDLTGITFIEKTGIPSPKYLDELVQQIKSVTK